MSPQTSASVGGVGRSRAEIDRGWARKDLAGQVRQVAGRLPGVDPRRGRLRDLALDLELANSDSAAAPILSGIRDAGVAVEVRD